MNFSEALKEIKNGKKLTRIGWNGKGMFIVYQKGYPEGIAINKNTSEALGLPESTMVKFRPYLMMKTAQGDCVPMQPTVSDILAEDWEIV